jgi:predicted TIM-barrel fold metal-dependent hydrolase
MNQTRRNFLTTTALAAIGAVVPERGVSAAEPIVDIHQHLGYSGRSDDALLRHQTVMGIATTILLPAGRPVNTPSTHEGVSNGLQAEALGNDPCQTFARAHKAAYRFGANDVPDIAGATKEIERYLKRGAIIIAEQKFGVECDSPAMQDIYALAQDHRVPVLMHWQYKMYNYGFDRFHRMLEKYPRVNFLGHAQTWWANVDKNYVDDDKNLYPKGPIVAGGLTDRYLSDYPNMHGDLSAGSGLNALTRDEGFTREFLVRHQNKLIFGSDCSDSEGAGEKCIGSQTIATIRRLASPDVQRKLFYGNARKLFRRV